MRHRITSFQLLKQDPHYVGRINESPTLLTRDATIYLPFYFLRLAQAGVAQSAGLGAGGGRKGYAGDLARQVGAEGEGRGRIGAGGRDVDPSAALVDAIALEEHLAVADPLFRIGAGVVAVDPAVEDLVHVGGRNAAALDLGVADHQAEGVGALPPAGLDGGGRLARGGGGRGR